MSIASNGNIGIGTNNPRALLDITYLSSTLPENRDMLNIKTDLNWGLKVQQSSSDGNIQYNVIHRYFAVDYNSLTFKGANVGIGTNNPTSLLHVNGNFSVSGGTKSWRIKHPILENKDLIHVCIESPRADNLYRGRKQLINGECEVNLDLECNTTGGMTEGCFVLINKNIQVFVSNNETFDKVIGSVVGNKLTVTSDNVNASCFIDWLVIGERNDNEIINNASTSSNGSIIVEIDREEIPIRAPRTNYDTSNYDILEM
jgi:hypothetical protein